MPVVNPLPTDAYQLKVRIEMKQDGELTPDHDSMIDKYSGICQSELDEIHQRTKASEPLKKSNVDLRRPDYYTCYIPGEYDSSDNVPVECFDIIDGLGLNKHHYIATAFSYLWRCLHKENTLSDLKKAYNYIERAIKNLEQSNG